ncbi:MAG: hypothetical protein AB7N76_30615 [Planctomycetota bacterium]
MRAQARRAFSMLEVVVSMGVLALGLMGVMATMVTSNNLRATSRQNEYLQRQAFDYLANLHGWDTAAAARTEITSNPTWIPLGLVDEGASRSDVPAIRQSIGINVTASNARIMTEAEAAAAWPGHTYDFDRDGTHDSASSNLSAYGTVVPVELTATWADADDPNRTHSFTLRTILYPRASVAQ